MNLCGSWDQSSGDPLDGRVGLPSTRMQQGQWALSACMTLPHLGTQLDRLAGNHEAALPDVVNRLAFPEQWINPGFDDLQHEQGILRDHARVNNAAFQAGEALVDQWSLDEHRWSGCEPEPLDLVYLGARTIAAGDNLPGDLCRGDVDDALVGGRQQHKGVIAIAEHTSYRRRLELEHGVPGHRHDD